MPRRKQQIPLFDVKVTPAAKRNVAKVLNSGWLSTGPISKAFETAVAKRIQVPYAVAVNSATAGLQVALMAMELPRGGEVITTPLTMVATIEAILLAGLTPVFADINSETLCIDVDSVKRKLSRRTVALLPVDMAGYPCDYAALRTIARKRNISILSDSAHAFGTKRNNKTTAQLADVAVLSFYSTKNLTSGEGGMILTRDKSLAQKARLISRHGMTSNAHDRKAGKTWTYDVPFFGIKANLSDIHAAVGLGQLERFDTDQRRRAHIAALYTDALHDMSEYVILPPNVKSIQPSWHLYIMQLRLDKLTITRVQFILLMAEHGIECGLHYQPVFAFSYYRKKLGMNPKQYPETVLAAERIVTIPLYPTLTDAQAKYIAATIRSLLDTYKRI